MHGARIACMVRGIALVLAIGVFGAAGAEPYLHAASGFVCPDEVAGMAFTGVDDYESKHPGLGVACKYRLQGELFVDVYIFTAGMNPVPATIAHPVMVQLRAQTVREIEEFARSRGEKVSRNGDGIYKVDTDRGAMAVFYDSFIIESGASLRNTWVWLWTARNHIMKIRMTRPPSGELDQKRIRAFYEAVVRLAAK